MGLRQVHARPCTPIAHYGQARIGNPGNDFGLDAADIPGADDGETEGSHVKALETGLPDLSPQG